VQFEICPKKAVDRNRLVGSADYDQIAPDGKQTFAEFAFFRSRGSTQKVG
jgi:hypothetical protein